MAIIKLDRIGSPRACAARAWRMAATSALFAWAMLVVAGCASFGGSGKANESGSRVVARAGEWTLTEAELNDEMRGELLKEEIDYTTKVHDSKQHYVAFLVDSRLIIEEAKRRGLEPSELMKVEVGTPAENVSEEEVRALYDQYRDRIGGRSYKAIHADLRKLRVGQKREELKTAFLERLRSEAGAEIDLPYPPLPVVSIPGGELAPARGTENAPVTIVEFSDFQCPFCARMLPPIAGLLDEFPGKLRIVYRHFPLSAHPLAMPAAEASMCANEQGHFWPYHDLIFENQEKLSVEKLRELAEQVGLDLPAFDACVADSRFRAAVEADMSAGSEAGVQGTPAYFVNGQPVFGAEVEVLRRLIKQQLEGTQG